MFIKTLLAGTMLVLAATAASADIVDFGSNAETTWADGTFTSGLSGDVKDGFYNYFYGPNGAYNGYGQNNESILFNAPVELNSLTLGKCTACYDSSPTSFTVSLYNAADSLLTSQTIASSTTLAALTFDTANVSKATFSFTGGNDAYGDGRIVAWYNVNDVTYTVPASTGSGAVPEPAMWSMMIVGFGLVGATRRSRRTTVVAA